MNAIETVKNNLHELVVHTQDAEVLQKVEEYFHTLLGGKDWWDEISAKEKQLIEKGAKELDRGEGIPHEVVRMNINRKLGKN